MRGTHEQPPWLLRSCRAGSYAWGGHHGADAAVHPGWGRGVDDVGECGHGGDHHAVGRGDYRDGASRAGCARAGDRHQGAVRWLIIVDSVFYILLALSVLGQSDLRGLLELILPIVILVLANRRPARAYFRG